MCGWQYLITVYSYIFILVTVSFKEPKFSMLIKSSLLIFFLFMDGASVPYVRNLCLTQGPKEL